MTALSTELEATRPPIEWRRWVWPPLVGLTGASGLSGVVTFLGVYKIPFIIFGLLVNVVGIVVSLRTIRRERAHLQTMQRAVATEPAAAPACH